MYEFQRAGNRMVWLLGAGCITVIAVLSRCNINLTPPGGNGNTNSNTSVTYSNSTDPTNKGAAYVGANACRQCHPEAAAHHAIHGHANMLTRVQGEPPKFPSQATRAGVPSPPEGIDWSQVSYVIGGYTRKARFIDNDGYIYTTGQSGVPTEWILDFPANGTTAGFVDYEPDAGAPKAYGHSCFSCHVTGARAQDEDFPEFQENRPGFMGTWEEAGVQCEACHGPGSKHFATVNGQVVIDKTAIYVSTEARTCGRCHTRGDDPNTILARDGYIRHYEQWPELLASGGHASFDCTTCHVAHVSTNYDRATAIRNSCTDCHTDMSMARHAGKVFTRGDYTENLSCESCHMPFATRSASSATAEVVGALGRQGDIRTHIFRIDTDAVSYTSMFTEDGSAVRKDASGRAAVSLDFVCLRCHNGIGTFEIGADFIRDIARNIHGEGS